MVVVVLTAINAALLGLPLGDAVIIAGGLGLAAALVRSRRLGVIIGCGVVAAGTLMLLQERASGQPPTARVTQTELTHARSDYFRRTIAGSLPRQRSLTAALQAGRAPETRREALRWFKQARLGMFIHYGPTTLFAAPSDRLWWHAVERREFVTAARAFHPHPGVTSDWVALAKRVGASYITVTVKHHDGFGLWNSRLTGWDVGPERDLLRPLALACRRAHLRLFVYYSLLDLHEPTYATDKDAYLLFVQGQLRELLTGYGKVAGVWFDGWNRQFGSERLESLYDLVHRLQPWALVATNHHRRPLAAEDFQIFEGAFPGQPGPSGVRPPLSGLHHEVALKLGKTWFWGGPQAATHLELLPSLLRRAGSRNATLLADIPPRPDGTFSPAVVTAAVSTERTGTSSAPTR